MGYMSEDSPTRPESLYGTCKLAFMNVADRLTAAGDLSFVWPRVFNLFGPMENRNRLLPDVILGLLQGKRVKLTPGEQMMDFLHVHDTAAAIWAVAQSTLRGPVNIGSGKPVEVRTLVKTAAALIGQSELLDFGAIPYNPLSPSFICANNKRLRQETGWRAKFTLESGVEDTVDWWRSTV
jgi:nucleoside-diphosphate-sugar epimerase